MNRDVRPRRRTAAERRAWLVGAAAALCLSAGDAQAATPTPVLDISVAQHPTHLTPGRMQLVDVQVRNLAQVPAVTGATVTVDLPDGVTGLAAPADGNATWRCPGTGGARRIVCTSNLQIGPRALSRILIAVNVGVGARGAGTLAASIAGGGALRSDAMSVESVISDEAAPFGITTFRGWAVEPNGMPARQAGAHPDATTEIGFSTTDYRGTAAPTANMKDITVDLPVGLVGDPSAYPTCTPFDVANRNGAICSPESQVGTVDIMVDNNSPLIPTLTERLGVYNIEPPPGLPGRFAFQLNGVVTNIDPVVRTGGDYGITARISNISQTLAVIGARMTLWGVPADSRHDAWRFDTSNPRSPRLGARSAAPLRPFMTAPTSCTGRPLLTSMRASSWQQPDVVHQAEFSTDFYGDPLVVEGCDRLPFDPGFVLHPSGAAKRGAPSGVQVDLSVPQNEGPDALQSAHLETAMVTLPQGMVVNPSSAQGLQACSPAQIDIDGPSSPNCPNASKIGTITIDTPLLDEPLAGSVYLAAQRQNPFGTTLALYLVAEGKGVVVKLPGRIDPDPSTGQLTATFDNNPQVPFSKLSLDFKTGPRAPLSLPTTCGPATTTAQLTPWSGTPPVTVTSSFVVSADGNGAPCPPLGFLPVFKAGMANPSAGEDSTFALGFTRTDEEEEFGGITVEMPKGLLARIGSTTLCSDAAANAGTCGEEARVGTVTTGAGAGSNPIGIPGRAYITGPYKGAPFGLSIVVPAIAGPFDLGTVVVRAAIHVDRDTTQIRIVSDPLPRILEGIPLQVRLVDVRVDRLGFMFNPTNCTATNVVAQIGSTLGRIANVSNRFQVGDCASLKFAPRMTLRVGSRGHTRGPGVSTPLLVTLRMPSGNANNRSVTVTLPRTMNARLEVLSNEKACSLDQFKAERCPINIGTATANTPVLRDPLSGNVYLVRNPARRLPDVMVALKGRGDAATLSIDVTGKVQITRDLRVQTIFDTVPDAPISQFQLRFRSGRNGALGLVNNICVARFRKATDARLAFVAQSNRKVSRTQQMQVAGCKKAKAIGRRGARRGRRTSARRGSRRK